MIIGLVGLLAFGGSLEFRRCNKVQFNSERDGQFFYWTWVHRKVSHGICAAMYTGDTHLWAIDLPEHGQPTAQYTFNSRSEAEAFGNSRCWSIDKEWTAGK